MAKAQPKKTQSGNDFFFKIAKLKSGQKTGILVGVIVLVLVGFYYLYYQPYTTRVAALQGEIDQLTASVASEQSAINKHKPIADYVAPVKDTFDYLSSFLTTEDEIPRLMQIISSLGAQSGVRVVLFEPKRDPVLHSSYAEIEFSMDLEGPFMNVVKFFFTMSNIPRIINIRSIALDNPVMGDNLLMIIKVKCAGSTYRLLSAEEEKKVKEAAGGA